MSNTPIIGKTYLYRAYDGQTFHVTVLKKFLCFVLLSWARKERWDYSEPYTWMTVTSWRPAWRLLSKETWTHKV